MRIVTHSGGTHTCCECGRQYDGSSGYDDHYCSSGCYEKRQARLKEEQRREEAERREKRRREMREKGKKVLDKWEKALAKDRKRIDKLSAAVRADDPDAIAKAIKRGLLKRAGGFLAKCLILIGLWTLLKPFWKNFLEEKLTTSRVDNTVEKSATVPEKVGVNANADSAVTDVQQQEREDQLLERRRELLQSAVEDDNATAPVAEQE